MAIIFVRNNNFYSLSIEMSYYACQVLKYGLRF